METLMKLVLTGKKYYDTVITIHSNKLGETNDCVDISRRMGGARNFPKLTQKYEIEFLEVGSKEAYVLENVVASQRTSYTKDIDNFPISENYIKKMNRADWVHVCYIDDIEDPKQILNLEAPYSVDFCKTHNRLKYLEILKKAKIIFDSRERKDLYQETIVDTPIILHDPDGCEIIVSGQKIYEDRCKRINNLNVNGAGDLFAKHFLDLFLFKKNVKKATSYALKQTTHFLKNRNKQ
tara:strand:- start:1326 stop:2036 length:711 start_codon:yes stop_codon:yes gene_type:complete